MFLVTGCPRSGTGYIAKLLQQSGLDVGHEVVGNDGIVSWLHAGEGRVPWLHDEIKLSKYDNIVHIVRHPIDVISSMQTLTDESFDYILDNFGVKFDGKRSLKLYMWCWLRWNELCEKLLPNMQFFRVEDLSNLDTANNLIKTLNGKQVDNVVSTTTNSRPHDQYSWFDLEKEDLVLCEQIKSKAIEYGYKIVTFGAVMMAKNEESNLPRCLESIKNVVDEIVIVDTGSNDNTVNIAESYGARVFHHPWENNFSKHRNQGLKYSKCDWVFIIDCDEELNGDCRALRQYVESVDETDYNAIAIMLKDIHSGNSTMQFNAVRIFRRGNVHFEDIVHNRPVFDGAAAMADNMDVYWLNHYGYDLTPEQRSKKHERTVSLLQKRIEDNPKDYAAYFYLSQVAGTDGDIKECKRLIEIYIKNKDRLKTPFNASAYFTHLQCLQLTSGYNDEFKDALSKYSQIVPDDLDIIFYTIQYAVDKSDVKLIKNASDRFIDVFNMYRDNPIMQASRFTYSSTYECLATALYYSATMSLGSGMGYLNAFAKVLEQTSETFRNKAAGEMQAACKKMNITYKG